MNAVPACGPVSELEPGDGPPVLSDGGGTILDRLPAFPCDPPEPPPSPIV
jgi:hypothetical protein